MRCPFCGYIEDKVVDSRAGKIGDTIRRRRECMKCGRRFTTYERIDEIPYMVVKKDGSREKFDRQKIQAGLLKACEKRPVPVNKLEEIVDEAEAYVAESPDRERPSSELGELAREGFSEVSLTVTTLNSGAVRLYERLGFHTFREFGAFVWSQP